MSIVPLLDGRTAGTIIDGAYISQLVANTRGSNGTAFNSAGVNTTYGSNIFRPDHYPDTGLFRGWLIEGARTNSIRNGNATGAVAGTPGSMPTNWFNNSSGGLTREVVGTSSVNGIPVVRLRYSGTATLTTAIAFFPESNTQVTASNGQTWSGSLYLALVSGTLPTPQFALSERDAAGTSLVNTAVGITPTSTIQRFTVSRTFNNASTAFAQAAFTVAVVNGVAYDFTIDIGANQLELGAFASSYIPTTGATATRAADSAVISSLASIGFNATEGTLLVEFETMAQNAGAAVAYFSDNTISNQIGMRRLSGTPANMTYEVATGGASQVADTFTSIPATTRTRAAFAWKANDFASVMTGKTLITDTSGTIPTVNRLFVGMRNNGGSVDHLFGWISRLVYYPTRLDNATLTNLVA